MSEHLKPSSDFNWSDDDRSAYINGNYSNLALDDAQLDEALIKGLVQYDKHTPILGQLSSGLELGVGGAARGPAFIAPLIHAEGTLHITDVSANNVRATQKTMEEIKHGRLGIWTEHQEHMGRVHPAWRQAFARAALLGTYDQLDVAKLKPDMAETISLGYLIESKGHENVDEWRRDLRGIARAAIRFIHLRQTDESEAYMAGRRKHLAVSVTRDQTEEELDKYGFTTIISHTVRASGQARQDDDGHAYSGFSGIIAERR